MPAIFLDTSRAHHLLHHFHRFLLVVAIFLSQDSESLAHWIKKTHAPRNPRPYRWNLGTKAVWALSRLMLIRLGFTLDFDERFSLSPISPYAHFGAHLMAAYGQISFILSLVLSPSPWPLIQRTIILASIHLIDCLLSHMCLNY